jgi:hypothetical protein
MNTRRSAVIAFVSSLILVVISLGVWVAVRGQGVGTDLDRVTLATPSVNATVAGGQGDAQAPSQDGPSPGGPTLPRPAEVPVLDATRIEGLDEVQPPRRVSIPSVDIAMPVAATGVARDGQMELPDDPRRIGWYRFGALPGDDRGSAVLGGHVDSERYGTGPLARLASVREGARITVTGADGERIPYAVTSVERIQKAALPVDRIFDPDVAHRLVIVTCGGRFLPDAGGYEDNIVVIATPVG